MKVVVIVVDEIGKCPRIIYHTRSLIRGGCKVDLCGYESSNDVNSNINTNSILSELKLHKNLHIHYLPINFYKFPFFSTIKNFFSLNLHLYKLLYNLRGSDFILLQNPPSFPILSIIRFYVLFVSRSTRVIIDWNDFDYIKTNQKLNSASSSKKLYTKPLIKFIEYYEWIFGKAFIHLTTSITMGHFLRHHFGVSGRRIIPLNDRPIDDFQPLSIEKIDDFFNYLKQNNDVELNSLFKNFNKKNGDKLITTSLITDLNTNLNDEIENFNVLIKGLKIYDDESQLQSKLKKLPNLLIIIFYNNNNYIDYEKQINLQDFKNITIKFLNSSLNENSKTISTKKNLNYKKYLKILSLSDLYISFYKSFNGINIPIDLINISGCGIPIISISFLNKNYKKKSLNYLSISELIKDNINGIIIKQKFNDNDNDNDNDILNLSVDLSNNLENLLSKKSKTKFLKKLKLGSIRESTIRWDEIWLSKIGPMFGVGEYKTNDFSSFSSSSDSEY